MSAGRPEPPQNIATAIAEVSERAALLVHEEIELAKAEVTEKMTKLVKGAIVGAAAGVFFLLALVFALIGCAWLLYFYLPVGDFAYFWGFFGMAVILIVFGVVAGLIAARAVKRSSPPVPTLAIAEAQKIRETLSASASRPAAPATGSASTVAPPPPPPFEAVASPSSGSEAPVAVAKAPSGPTGSPTADGAFTAPTSAAAVDERSEQPPATAGGG